MEKILRLENTRFGFSSILEDEVDKVLEFNSGNGALKVHILKDPCRIPFKSNREKTLAPLRKALKDFNFGAVRIIHNLPVPKAYSTPFKIYLDITLACQLQCPFCLLETKSNEAVSLPLSVIKQIAAEIKELGVMYVKIGGGDPFLHPDFPEILSLLHSTECFVTISTNGVTMTSEISQLLAKANVRVSVSIEGMEETNDGLRGFGHFRKALKALEILKKTGAEVLLRTTLLRQNLNEVPKLVELAKSREVMIKFAYCRPAGRAVRNQMVLGFEDSLAYLRALEYLNDPRVLPYVFMDEGMMFRQPPEILAKLLRGRMCGAANRSMHIDAYGKVSPCIFLGPTFSFGKVYQDGTIRDFWQGKVGNRFQTVREIRQPQECDGCDRICKNECLANRFYFWGSFEKQDPNCLYYTLRRCKAETKQ